MKIFAIKESEAIGEQIAQNAGISLSKLEEMIFEDGESKIRAVENVRGENVYIVQSLNQGRTFSANDKLVRLLFLIASLKDSGAAKIIVIAPYLCYARKDRKTRANDPVVTRYVAQLIETAGATSLFTLDVHNLQAFNNAFRIPCENIDAGKFFLPSIVKEFQEEEIVILSPDIGALKRAEKIHRELKNHLRITPTLAFVEKYRSGGEIWGEEKISGEVSNRVVIITDDLISTGKTIARSAAACKRNGARKVIACITHGLFSHDSEEHLLTNDLDEIRITNSVTSHFLETASFKEKVKIIDIAPIFGKLISTIEDAEDLSEIIL